MSTVDLLDRIDELTAPTGHCRVCDAALDPDGPSSDFCSEQHQRRWARAKAGASTEAMSLDDMTEEWAAVGRAMTAAVQRSYDEVIRPMCESVTRALSYAGQHPVEVFVAAEPPAEPPLDPMAHALRARQHRNTGPAVHADPRRNRRR